MPKSILIIDDEELITKTLLKMLGRLGYDAVVARSGPEAIAAAAARDFDLIISDVRMPDMDGIETIKALRQQREKSGKKTIPEVMITGFADIDKYEKAMDLEVADYLSKPFDNDQFIRIVKEQLER